MDWKERHRLRERYREVLPSSMEAWAEDLCWREVPPDVGKLAQAVAEWSGREEGALAERNTPGVVRMWEQRVVVPYFNEDKRTVGAPTSAVMPPFVYTVSLPFPFKLQDFIGTAFREFLKERGVIQPD